MRTLADIKRRMTEGTRLEVIEQTAFPDLEGTIRTVVSSTAGKLRFTSSHTGGQVHVQGWPKAADITIIDADTYQVDLKLPGRHARLRFLPPAQPGPASDSAAITATA